MKRLTTIVVAVLAMMTTAQAAMHDYARAGFWKAARGSSSDGSPMCAMYTRWPDGRYVGVKWADGELFVHVAKPRWRVAFGTEVRLFWQFDRKPEWSGPAYGDVPKQPGVIGATITDERHGEKFKKFIFEFADADKWTLRFPGGNEATWVVDLKGSETIAGHFVTCIDSLERDNTQPHQPSRPSSPLQPHGLGES